MISRIEMATFRKAFEFALETLTRDLEGAQECLAEGLDDRTIGSLIDVEDRFSDMLAARRLFINARRLA